MSHVLRGESVATMAIDDLPQSACSGVLLVPDGAVIALALDAQAFSPPMDVNAPAFSEGISWVASSGGIGPAEVLTIEQVFDAADVRMPDTAVGSPETPPAPHLLGIALLGLAVLAGHQRGRGLRDAARG